MEQERTYASARMSAHAIDEIRARHISGDDVRAVLAAPEQTLTVHPGRIVLQSLQPVGPAGRCDGLSIE